MATPQSTTSSRGTGTDTGRILSSSTLTGDSVRNAAGEDLGDIKDLMIDTRNGTVQYAVVSFGGWLGMGNKLFAVPWDALRLDTDHHCLVLDIPKETLKSAPGFDKNHWPDFADPGFNSELNRYYASSGGGLRH
ncbi:MAG TPA: PRC-barrel domain-containing protein [Rhodanobacteraceae bacterium]|nr:PRC-barrel domain-containing protein [Rhodanobacteraceae bacterium]